MSEKSKSRRHSPNRSSNRSPDHRSAKSIGSPERRSRSHSVYSGSTRTEHENTDSHDSHNKYKRLAKKLTLDKSKLKEQLRELLNEITNISTSHSKELEKTRDYFQAHIDELSYERDQILDELEQEKMVIVQEREKLTRQYEQKLQSNRENTERRTDGKNSTQIKRLENTVLLLQQKLDEQNEEREKIKENAEQFFNSRTSQMQQNIVDLEDQLKKSRELHAKERRELMQLTQTFTLEKENMRRAIEKDRDAEINKILEEKNTTIIALQGLKDDMEKRSKAADKTRDEQQREMHVDMENKTNSVMKRCELAIDTLKKNIEEQKDHHAIELQRQRAEYENKFELERKDHAHALASKEFDNNKYILSVKESTHKELERLLVSNEKLQNDVARLNDQTTQAVLEKEEKLSKEYEQLCVQNRARHEAQLYDLQTEKEELRERLSRNISDLNENNEMMKKQISTLKESLKTTQVNSQDMNNQFIVHLNKQKDIFDQTLNEKEERINALEKQLKKLSDEVVDKLTRQQELYAAELANREHTIEKFESQKKQLIEETTEIVKRNKEFSSLELEQYTTKCRKLEEQNQMFSKQRESALTELIETQGRMGKMESALKIVSERNGEVVKESEQKLKNMESTLKAVTNELDSAKSELVKEIQKASFVSRDFKDLLTNNNALKAEFVKLEQASSKQKNELERHMAILQRLRPEKEEIEQKCIETVKSNKGLQEEMRILQSKIGDLEHEKAVFLGSLGEKDRNRSELMALHTDRLNAKEEEFRRSLELKNEEHKHDVEKIMLELQKLTDHDKAVSKLEEELKNAPPKIDATAQKGLTDALSKLRHAKIELITTQDDNLKLTQRLLELDMQIKKIVEERNLIVESNNELKTNMVNNLNQQKELFDQTNQKNEARIRELETMLAPKKKRNGVPVTLPSLPSV